ncbi:hypothetical protein BJV82DRAFT_662260 [Fennellomyces sp. T-0311]|nr:hypothetical protein BJV82DRAFT_662260 [Fennellomyces sp. T-0311]
MLASGCSKVVFITGSTGGLGRAAAKRFLDNGHNVVITGRTAQQLEEAIIWMQPSSEARKRLHTIELDLESLTSIRKAVCSFKFLSLPLDILLNNAGRTTTKLEYVQDTTRVEKTIFANAIGPWYLSMLLMPYMRHRGRILFVTSGLHDPEGDPSLFGSKSNNEITDPNLFNLLDGAPKYGSLAYYKISKLAVIWLAYVMATKYPFVDINTFSPGFVPITDLIRQKPWIFRTTLGHVMRHLSSAIPEHQSISEYVYYATSKDLNGVSGAYFAFGKRAESSTRSKNMQEAHRFWELACEICNLSAE